MSSEALRVPFPFHAILPSSHERLYPSPSVFSYYKNQEDMVRISVLHEPISQEVT